MCGFAGFLDPARATPGEALAGAARTMAGTLIHRGPDDSDTWVDAGAGIALGHRRLSIIDLSQHGHQPMLSHSGRYVVAYNGELYNFREVRRELEQRGNRFIGHSDTEVLLAAIEEWGLVAAVQRFIGMFAFALWDRQDRRLHLVRDRIGEKPLYYGWQRGVFLFGSELKALRTHPAWEGGIDRSAIALYLRFGYVPAPWSIHRDIRKLQPGCVLSIGTADAGAPPDPAPYWSAQAAAEAAALEPWRGSEEEATDALEELLTSAVGQQMVADVPLGAFLSGGVDSSTVVALMQAQAEQPVRTFTIGFHEPGYNEAVHAKAVAGHLGTAHTELYVTPQEAMDVVPLLPVMYDEPFADSSQIPTHLVSRLARQHVTVSLSGDGGDELFGGYNRYFIGPRVWRGVRAVPPPLRRAASAFISRVGAHRWTSVGRGAERVFGSHSVPPRLGEKLTKLAGVLDSDSPALLFKSLVSATSSPLELLRDASEPLTMLDDGADWSGGDGLAARMMYLDALTYLPDDILVKVDRAAMACSLETRAPFLDHRVVEFAWRLPVHFRIRKGTGKWLLRRVLFRYVPPALIERPKAGFAVPVSEWLRGPLRPWAQELLDERRLRDEGFFDTAAVQRVWREHDAGLHDRHFVLWALLMFQAWYEAIGAGAAAGVSQPG